MQQEVSLKQEKWEERRLVNELESGSYKKPQNRSEQMETPERVIEQAEIDSQEGNYSGSNEPGILDKILNWFTWGDERRRQQDIRECKEMWENGQMEKMIDDRYEYRDDQYRERVMRENNMGSGAQIVGDPSGNYVKEFEIGISDTEFNNGEQSGNNPGAERIQYYKHVLERNGENFDEVLDNKGFIVIAQENKGADVYFSTTNEDINDRITFVVKKDDKYFVTECYRSSLDTGKYDVDNNVVHTDMLQDKIDSGVYDVLYGIHNPRTGPIFGFNLFDINNIKQVKDENVRADLLNKYNNGTLFV